MKSPRRINWPISCDSRLVTIKSPQQRPSEKKLSVSVCPRLIGTLIKVLKAQRDQITSNQSEENGQGWDWTHFDGRPRLGEMKKANEGSIRTGGSIL